MPISPFAYGPKSKTLVTTDGADLLVHDSDTEGPTWMRSMSAPIVGAANAGDRVIALAANGELAVLSGDEGAEIAKTSLDLLASGLAASKSKLAVLGGASVEIVGMEGERRASVDLAEPMSAAFDASGERLAIGTVDGDIAIARASDGVITGQVRAAAKVTGLAYHERAKVFLASVGHTLTKVTPKDDGVDLEPIMTSDKLDWSALAISEEGSVLAARVGDHRVVLLSLHDYKLVGQITFEREVGALEFGADNFLGVALDRGDGNKVNLLTGAVHRTDPHDGRVRNSWILIPDIKTDLVAKALQKGRTTTPLSRPSPYGVGAPEKAKKPAPEAKKKEKKPSDEAARPKAKFAEASSAEKLFTGVRNDNSGKVLLIVVGGVFLISGIILWLAS